MSWPLSLLLGVLVVLAITAATGYFVAQEFAFMAVDRSRLKARAVAGDAAAARALAVTRRTSFMLSGAQLGITVTALVVGFVAEPLIGEALGEALGDVGVPTAVGVAVGTAVALLASTVVQMLFGELFPKNLAIARAEAVAIRLARSTTIYLGAFGWLIRVFDRAANLLLRAVRIEPVHDVEHSATVRDLEHIVADSREAGDLPEELSVLLDRVLDFPSRSVGHAMIARARVDVVRTDDTLAEVWDLMSAGHSRYPVLDADDEIVGVVHLQDVLGVPEPREGPVARLLRPTVLVPTAMALPEVLRRLTETRTQLACVVDEYGGFDGIVTLEDLAEELVGEIADEHDAAECEPSVPAADGQWVFAGDLHVDEIERVVHRELPEGDYETLAGLMIATYGALPEVGTSIDIELGPEHGAVVSDEAPRPDVLRLEVLSLERHVPALVQAAVTPGEPEEERSG